MEFVDICGGRGQGSVHGWRASLPRYIGIILALFLLLGLLCIPCAGQSDYELRDARVTPDYGYGDFNYSAQIGIIGTTTDVSGKYKVVLRIYDEDRLLREDSSMERRFSNSEIGNRLSEPFLFGPFNFQRDFGITTTKNASFEFAVLKSGTEVARSSLRGPEVEPPHIIGTPQFNAKPYFFQGLAVSASFKDQAGLSPSTHIELKGPLGTDQERAWNTGEVPCSIAGTVYTSRISQETSSYRDGGNFSFEIVYNNLRMDPMVFGPYNFTVMPYAPSIERFSVAGALDYTNFTIRAFIKDEGVRIVGGSPIESRADLSISHPSKGSLTYVNSQPRVEGGYLVFDWDREEVPFDRGDVVLSDPRKGGQPFEARLVYRNDNWDFGVESSNVSFIVVEEVPTLDLRYSPIVYVRSGQVARESVTATIGFSKGAGKARLVLSGPGLDYNRTVEGISLGGDSYRYEWQMTFDDSNIDNNYTLSLAFMHPALDGGFHEFEGRDITVRPISIEYEDASVLPSGGRWDESFVYSTTVDSTVDCEVLLQIYNPCSREWEDWSSKKVSSGISALNWTLNPFRYECPGMEGSSAMYRFKASFQGADYISRPFFGPFISASAPKLVSLDLSPTIYVPVGGSTSEAVRATVEYAGGMGDMRLILSGPGMSMDETIAGVALGKDRYRYDWTVPFRYSHASSNYTATLLFTHPSLAGGSHIFENRTIEVRPIYLAFEEGSVLPSRGRWNDSFLYSVKVNSTSEMDLSLQIYNPCSMEWEDRKSGAVGRGVSSLNWTLSPYEYSCPDITGRLARYRFKARFDDIEYGSRVYYGPMISGGQPELISLDYDREVYVNEESSTYQKIRAVIDSPLGESVSQLRIYGPGKRVDVSSPGQALGGDRYAYWWSIPFGVENAGNHTISLRFVHPELDGGGYSFADAPMVVLLEEGMPAEPQLVDLNYTPLLLIDGDEVEYQEIEAVVASPAGLGKLWLGLAGPDKDLEELPEAEEMESGIYRYKWSVPFDRSNAQKIYKISLSYILGEKSYALGDRMMAVAMRDGPAPQIWEPTLTIEYDRTLYVPHDGSADQIVRATVNYSQGMGELELNISGARMDFSGIEEGRRANGQRYLYEWSVPFNSSHIEENYIVSLSYWHPSLPEGSYRFADRYMQVKAAGGGDEGGLAFENGRVVPENGSSFTHFAFCVDLKTDLGMADVELLTSDPGSTIWTSQGLVHYDGSNGTLYWPDVRIDGEAYGVARYRFKHGTTTSQIFQGPFLEPSAMINASVDPMRGPLYSTTALKGEISRVYTYAFKVDLGESLGEGSTEVRLDVYDPMAKRWIDAGSRTYDSSRTWLEYQVNFADLSFQELFLNGTKYRFVARDRVLGEFPGPNITVNLRNERAIRVGDKITYQVDVRSVQPAKIALAYTTDNVRWHRSDTRDYDLPNEEWKTLEWAEYPRYYAYEFEVVP